MNRESGVGFPDGRFANLGETLFDSPDLVFRENSAFLFRSYGSSKTQNLEDAPSHAEGVASLAGTPVKQVPSVREQRPFAYRLPILWLLQGPAGLDGRRRVGAEAISELNQ